MVGHSLFFFFHNQSCPFPPNFLSFPVWSYGYYVCILWRDIRQNSLNEPWGRKEKWPLSKVHFICSLLFHPLVSFASRKTILIYWTRVTRFSKFRVPFVFLLVCSFEHTAPHNDTLERSSLNVFITLGWMSEGRRVSITSNSNCYSLSPNAITALRNSFHQRTSLWVFLGRFPGFLVIQSLKILKVSFRTVKWWGSPRHYNPKWYLFCPFVWRFGLSSWSTLSLTQRDRFKKLIQLISVKRFLLLFFSKRRHNNSLWQTIEERT